MVKPQKRLEERWAHTGRLGRAAIQINQSRAGVCKGTKCANKVSLQYEPYVRGKKGRGGKKRK